MSEPDEVTVPVRVRPLTVPAPATLVTVPVVELVPAPIAVRKSAAFRDETVLSALKRGKVTALGLVIIKRLPPSVVAPRLVRASPAVEAPVPPSATARSVIPVIEPPVMVTEFAFCVEIVPRPRLVRAPAAALEPVPPEATGSAVPSVSDVRWVVASTTFVASL